MPQFHAVVPTVEVGDLADEVRRLFDDLERSLGPGSVAKGECTPALDVVETDEEFQVLVDLPGVAAAAVRVMIKGAILVVAGYKPKAEVDAHTAAFHLVERGFGRFVRGVRITCAFDGARGRATFRDGELAVVLPKIYERRGCQILVPIETDRDPAGR